MTQLMVISNAWTKPSDIFDGISAVDHLFNRLDGMYPNIFKANFKGVDSIVNWKNSWAEALHEDSIHPAEVKEGLKNSRRLYEFPPSLPQFLKACRHVDYESLFIESVRGHVARRASERYGWSNPIAFWAGVEFGIHDLIHAQYDKVKTRWQSCVEKVQKEGFKPIPDLAKRLPEPEFKKDSVVAKKAMGAMKSMFNVTDGIKHWTSVINGDDFEKLPLITKQHAAKGLSNLGVTVPDHAVKYLRNESLL